MAMVVDIIIIEDNQIDNSLYKPLPEIEFNSPPVPPPHLIVSNTEDSTINQMII